jgi:DNA-binding response OmpR family regulator
MAELSGDGLRALVVDDDEPTRQMLRTVLELEGWEVHEAEDGGQALALARAERPHGIVLDVMMPVKDGFEVLAELRQTEHGRQMAIVLLTAKAERADILRGTRLGADHYLTKPFDPSEVVSRLAFHSLRRNPGARTHGDLPARPGRRRPARKPRSA